VEQNQSLVALDASQNMAPATSRLDVGQTIAIVPKDIAVLATNGV
jgi:hypothetical protein